MIELDRRQATEPGQVDDDGRMNEVPSGGEAAEAGDGNLGPAGGRGIRSGALVRREEHVDLAGEGGIRRSGGCRAEPGRIGPDAGADGGAGFDEADGRETEQEDGRSRHGDAAERGSHPDVLDWRMAMAPGRRPVAVTVDRAQPGRPSACVSRW